MQHLEDFKTDIRWRIIILLILKFFFFKNLNFHLQFYKFSSRFSRSYFKLPFFKTSNRTFKTFQFQLTTVFFIPLSWYTKDIYCSYEFTFSVQSCGDWEEINRDVESKVPGNKKRSPGSRTSPIRARIATGCTQFSVCPAAQEFYIARRRCVCTHAEDTPTSRLSASPLPVASNLWQKMKLLT